ncbi:hypothetical protein KIL84_022930 [Mauremys mutica]|uniref:Uncharacterized protein n=1 Tax=Mauremys mutica TaxID=74926 RepID=A0A9D3WR24_9SAUR|nr:hypothetical protein KIL84_022930 [Mauremys mutica]
MSRRKSRRQHYPPAILQLPTQVRAVTAWGKYSALLEWPGCVLATDGKGILLPGHATATAASLEPLLLNGSWIWVVAGPPALPPADSSPPSYGRSGSECFTPDKPDVPQVPLWFVVFNSAPLDQLCHKFRELISCFLSTRKSVLQLGSPGIPGEGPWTRAGAECPACRSGLSLGSWKGVPVQSLSRDWSRSPRSLHLLPWARQTVTHRACESRAELA